MQPTGIRIGVVLTVLLSAAQALPNQLRLVDSGDDAITVELATGDYTIERVVHGGESFFRVEAPGFGATTDAGLPLLPLKGALLGVPFGADVSLEIVSVESEPLGPRRVEPAPLERVVRDGEFSTPVEDYILDEEFYAGRSTFPRTVAELGFDTTFRHQRVIQVIFHPFQYSAAADELTLHGRIVVRLRLSGGEPARAMRPVLVREPHWEAVYSGTVLNYREAKEWRARPAPRRTLPGIDLRRDTETYRIEVGETGVYRVDFAELAAEGLAGTLAIDDVAVYQRSFDEGEPDPFVETPLPVVVVDANENDVFDGADYVVFLAQSFADQHVVLGYEDRYDTGNVYWFGSGAGLAAGMETRSGWLGAGGLTPAATFRDTLHFEEEVYFDSSPPSNSVDLYQWTRSYKVGSTIHDDYELPFSLPGMSPSGDTRLRARYHGDLAGEHNMSLSVINGSEEENPIGVFAFTGISGTMSEDIYDSALIPPSYFTTEGNKLRTDGEGSYDGANLDWFEFSYAREYEADGGRLAFTSAGEIGTSQFEVGGFEGSELSVFDITDPWNSVAIELEDENVEPDGPGYRLVLQDDVADFTRYEAAESGACLSPLSMERRDDVNLRSREADMIVVSYDGFAAGVEPLIAHRESEGFVLAHARLSEVYDEFGGGLPGPQALRNYFLYAFEEWERQPQFVLIVGDASEDTREVLDSSSPNFMPTHLFFGGHEKLWASDQWYIRGEGSEDYLPQMFIGRLPASGTGQLANFVSKIIAYEDYSPDDSWRNNNLFVADDVWKYLTLDAPYMKYEYENRFTEVSEDLAETTAASPARIDTTLFILRRYTDPYHGDKEEGDISYAVQTANWVRNEGPRADLLQMIGDGAVLWNFEGHGHRYQLTHEQLFVASANSPTYNDISRLSNDDMPFIFLGFSCELSRFHHAGEGTSFDCIAEQMMQRDGGRGAVATYACSGIAWMRPNALLHEKVYEAFFADPTPEGPSSSYFWPRWSLGGTLAKATVKYLTDEGFPSLPQTFVIFGDPLMHIEFSPPSIQVTIDGEPHVSGDFLEATEDAVEIVADIIDEVEIDPTTIVIEETDIGEIDPGDYTVEAIGDTLGEQSRWYRLTYRTPVRAWSYDVRISATDVNGQRATFVLHVSEGQRILIRDVANHPNPFRNDTSIIYLLNQSGADVTVRIFTVGGRLIRVIEDAPDDLNYNRILWDGTDGDGDVVASGVYLYVIDVTGEDGSTVTSDVGRMVKIAGLGR